MTDKKDIQKNKGGRPSPYQDAFAKQAFKYSLLGATDAEMCKFFEVSEQTFNAWKNKFPKFLESIKKGKAVADANVATKLYTRAIGYTFEEVTFEKVGTKEEIEELSNTKLRVDLYKKKLVIKEVVPDTTAQIFWLKNRVKDKFKDRHDVGLDLSKLSEEELDLLIEKITTGQLKLK